MTIEEQAKLSFYEELAPVSEHDNVTLVMHIETKEIFVKKILSDYNRDIYDLIKRERNKYFPHIYEIIETDGKMYVIEEYIQGKSLEQYIHENNGIGLQEAASIMQDVCQAVIYLHSQKPPIIHRDLKPSNIIKDKDGIWKIIDLNTARYYVRGAHRDTEYLGTKNFAAPEQFGFKQTDQRTDIYALGLLFHIILTGKHPMEQRYHGEAEPIIEKCIMFEPDKRYQNVQSLLDDIIKTSKTKKKCPYLLPGFRSLNGYKMILAGIVYAFDIWIFFGLDVKNSMGNAATGKELWANRAGFAGFLFLTILLWGNYLDIHKKLPLLKSQKLWLKGIGCTLYTVILLFVIVMIILIFST